VGKLAATGAMLVLLLAGAGCAADEAASGTVRGTVVLSPPCPVEMYPLEPTPGPSIPGPTTDACGGPVSGATVRAFADGSEKPAATVTTGSDGRFTWELPEGNYRLEAVPSSSATGLGVPLDVTVTAGSAVDVTLRIDTGVQ